MTFDVAAIDWKAIARNTDREIQSLVEEAGGSEAVALHLLGRFGLPFVRYVKLSEWIGEAGSLQLVFSDGHCEVTLVAVLGDRGLAIRPVNEVCPGPMIRSTVVDLVRMCSGLLDPAEALLSGRFVFEGFGRGQVLSPKRSGRLDHPIAPRIDALLPRTAALLKHGMEAGSYLGGQLFVSFRGSTLVDDAFGESVIGIPMRSSTLHRWFCAGKPVTAVAVCQLWERGLLAPDRRVAEFLPRFAQLGKEELTIRHLLTHTAGLTPLGGAIAAYGFAGDTPCMAEMLERVIETPIREGWVPGRRGAYDLIGAWYALAGIVEAVTARDLQSYLREHVFAPLEMNDTHAGMSDSVFEQSRARIGAFHVFEAGRIRSFPPAEKDSSYLQCNPGTGICGTTGDLGRFYAGLLRVIRGDSLARILRPQTLESAILSHRAGIEDESLGSRAEFGLGFETRLDRQIECVSPRAFGLTGFEGAAEGVADPEFDVAIAAVRNGFFVNRRQGWGSIVEAVYDDLGLV